MQSRVIGVVQSSNALTGVIHTWYHFVLCMTSRLRVWNTHTHRSYIPVIHLLDRLQGTVRTCRVKFVFAFFYGRVVFMFRVRVRVRVLVRALCQVDPGSRRKSHLIPDNSICVYILEIRKQSIIVSLHFYHDTIVVVSFIRMTRHHASLLVTCTCTLLI
ncbi:hypothetical protein BCR39DRAFT_517685 [Naematelia encephala]|uniref:Uncharacterized protein n=1 Tax=Naematelia encephala TaxID=71784 RepID=A0A1Y2BHR8_9TREE|nr:hypothetical protein BCR39DRAFT_517685 [Naematelia encephala]